MAMEVGGIRCAKYTQYFASIAIIVLACITLGVGIWMMTDMSGYLTSMYPSDNITYLGPVPSAPYVFQQSVGQIRNVANILIASGILILLVGVFGIWAAYKDSKIGLLAYATLLFVFVILELAGGITWSIDKPRINEGLTTNFRALLDNYDYVQTTVVNNQIVVAPNQMISIRNAPATAYINLIQTWVGCCGYDHHGYTDFKNSLYWAKAGPVPPVFCCKLTDTTQLILEDPLCASQRTTENSWMSVGCGDKVTDWINGNTGTIVGVAVGIGLIDFLGILAALYQYQCLAQGYKEF